VKQFLLKKRLRVGLITALVMLVFVGVLGVSLTLNPTKADPDPPGTVHVTTWTAFVAAYLDPNCPKIVLDSDVIQPNASDTITGSNASNPNEINTNDTNSSRTVSLEIDGQGYLLHVGDRILRQLSGAPVGSVFYVHDIQLKQNIASATNNAPLISGYFIFRDSTGDTDAGTSNGRWTYLFENINILKRSDSLGGANHLFHSLGSLAIFDGVNRLEMHEEAGHTGGVTIADGASLYYQKMSHSNTSTFWFPINPGGTGTTAGAQGNKFIVGDNATFVSYYDYVGATSYPCIYNYYREIEVGENAAFIITVPGNAVRFQQSITTTLHISTGAVFSATTVNTGYATIDYSTSASFTADPGSEVYVVGYDTGGIIDIGSNNSTFTLNQPKVFDLRNKSSGGRVFDLAGNYPTRVVSIQNSDIDTWGPTQSFSEPSQLSFMGIGLYQLVGATDTNGGGTVSGDAVLGTYNRTTPLPSLRPRYYRRISGMNQSPEVLFDYPGDVLLNRPTDADKFIRVRVILGWTPDDNGADMNGNINMIPIFAGAAQACQVTLSSSDGSVSYSNILTDANGYVLYPANYSLDKLPNFLEANIELTAYAVRGGRGDPNGPRPDTYNPTVITVQDVTPPQPAQVSGTVYGGATAVGGYGAEPGATVTMFVSTDGGTTYTPLTGSAVVLGDGSWTFPLPYPISTGNKLRIYLTDEAGNRNPDVQTDFHDARFLPATVVTVASEPTNLYIRQIVQGTEPDAPDLGYGLVSRWDQPTGGTILGKMNVVYRSGVDGTDPGYTNILVMPRVNDYRLVIAPVLPQYYHIVGFKVSATAASNGAQTLVTGSSDVMVDPVSTHTAYITVYIAYGAQVSDAVQTNYSTGATDNPFGRLRQPAPISIALSCDNGIGSLYNGYTIRRTVSSSPYTFTFTSAVAGDGRTTDNANWTRVSGSAWGSAAANNTKTYTVTVPPNTIGTMVLQAAAADDPTKTVRVTVNIVNIEIRCMDPSQEMYENAILYVTSYPNIAKTLNFTASKGANWTITSQTGRKAMLSSAATAANDPNTLSIPAGYAGMIYIRAAGADGAGTRNFRVYVTKGTVPGVVPPTPNVTGFTVEATGAATHAASDQSFQLNLTTSTTERSITLTGLVTGDNITDNRTTWTPDGDDAAWGNNGTGTLANSTSYVVKIPAAASGTMTVIARPRVGSQILTVTINVMEFYAFQSESGQWLTLGTTAVNLTSPVNGATERYISLCASQSVDFSTTEGDNTVAVMPVFSQNNTGGTAGATSTTITANQNYKVTIPANYEGTVSYTLGGYTVIFHVTADVVPSNDVGVGETFEADGYEWRVLNKNGGETLIIAEHLLYTAQFHTSYTNWDTAILWSGSSLRTSLNGTFKNSLTTLGANIVQKTIYTRKGWNGSTYTDPISVTQDFIFLLSEEDVFGTAYTGTPNFFYNTVANTILFPDANSRKATVADGCTNGYWWLRSPRTAVGDVALGKPDGWNGAYQLVTSASHAVRPALFVNF
jgi:hypothetical protein